VTFEAPWALLLLLVIPGVIYLRLRLRRRPALRFSTTRNVLQAGPSLRQRLLWIPDGLRILALILITVALARPQEGRERIRDVSKGVAIEMVVDRSGSMGAEMEFAGLRLTRLETVKRVFDEFITGNGKDLPGRPNDLVGMIAFARYPDTVCPLTLAHGALSRFLEQVKLVKRRSEDGTAIGDATALAAARLKTAEQALARQTKGKNKDYQIKSKVIILLTDGQNNWGKRTPAQAAELAKQWGIKIYAIGIGSTEGIRTVQTPLGEFKLAMGPGVDQATLKAMAETTGGLFRMADDAQSLRAIYRQIDRLEKSEIESVRYLDYRELFTPFALTALGLLALEITLNCTFFRRIP